MIFLLQLTIAICELEKYLIIMNRLQIKINIYTML